MARHNFLPLLLLVSLVGCFAKESYETVPCFLTEMAKYNDLYSIQKVLVDTAILPVDAPEKSTILLPSNTGFVLFLVDQGTNKDELVDKLDADPEFRAKIDSVLMTHILMKPNLTLETVAAESPYPTAASTIHSDPAFDVTVSADGMTVTTGTNSAKILKTYDLCGLTAYSIDTVLLGKSMDDMPQTTHAQIAAVYNEAGATTNTTTPTANTTTPTANTTTPTANTTTPSTGTTGTTTGTGSRPLFPGLASATGKKEDESSGNPWGYVGATIGAMAGYMLLVLAWCAWDWNKKPRTLAAYAFIISLAISIGGTCIALGGMASLQAFCNQNGDIFDGVKESHLGQAKLLFTSCSVQFRFEWYGWALQVVFLIISLVCYMTENVHNYKAALWGLAATVITLATIYANDLWDLYDKTKDDLHTRGIITFLGYCTFCAGDYLMMFTGNALYHQKRSEWLKAHRNLSSSEKRKNGELEEVAAV